ncbi:MAG: ABC transporter permease [Blautia sp.]|uniref:ABC transporter permease n=1 Tax=Blautia sp. TaxID=1955243 RepID=UPI003993EE14
MTVFKGYMKVIRQNRGLILLYVAIFFACTILMQSMAGKTEKSYQAESLKVAVADGDGGILAKALETYLGNFHEIIPMENDISAMQEKLFYREVEYIVRIPDNFVEKCILNGEKISVTTIPDTYSGIYVDQQINSFFNNAKACLAAGLTEEETARALTEKIPVKVALTGKTGSTDNPGYMYYFRYLPYLFLALFGFVAGNILIVFSKKEVKNRMLASPVSARRQSLEGLLSMVLFGVCVMVFTLLAAVIYYGKDLYGNENFGYYLLNTLAVSLVSMSVAYLAGTLAPNKDALTGIVNILSLGMCFLCGVFVPLEYISKGVKTVSQFLPVYWYERANDILGSFTVLTENARIQIFQAVGIQLVFCIALVSLTLVISKYRRVGR